MSFDPIPFLICALKSLVWAGGVLVAIHWVGKGEVVRRRWLALAGLWAIPLVLWLSPEQLPVAVGHGTLADGMPGAAPIWLLSVAMGIWLAGSALCLARVGRDLRGIAVLLASSSSCRRASTHAGIPVLLSPDVAGPCLAGWWRPRILMPPESEGWSEAHWTAALDHEAEHARRGDAWHRLFTSLAQAVWWWNPAVLRLIRIYEVESECLCDAAAARKCGAQDYGRFLLAHAGYSVTPGMVASMAGGVLHQRVERLLADPGKRGFRRWLALGCAVSVLAGAAGICANFGTPRSVGGDSRVVPPSLTEEAVVRWEADPFPAP